MIWTHFPTKICGVCWMLRYLFVFRSFVPVTLNGTTAISCSLLAYCARNWATFFKERYTRWATQFDHSSKILETRLVQFKTFLNLKIFKIFHILDKDKKNQLTLFGRTIKIQSWISYQKYVLFPIINSYAGKICHG